MFGNGEDTIEQHHDDQRQWLFSAREHSSCMTTWIFLVCEDDASKSKVRLHRQIRWSDREVLLGLRFSYLHLLEGITRQKFLY